MQMDLLFYFGVWYILPIRGLKMIEVCENIASEVSCQGLYYPQISIINATYGRNEGTICPDLSVHASIKFPCNMNVTEKIKLLCQDHTTCSVTPSNSAYGGDPCPDIYKYLTIFYVCSVDDFINVSYEKQQHEHLHNVILKTDVMSFIDCALICTLNYNCYGFEYKPDDLKCHIVSRVTNGVSKVTYFVKIIP
ncbi:unnamed protein product [Mytilus coruscus]|uniref:SUEL-type lectin domain-containing protein n=1 Tax=Mytilus coruscus TaxID=42192 RepID=A0A6J8C7J0_MYTCO|nr:unnamed protein product [Mytilus coruscus]